MGFYGQSTQWGYVRKNQPARAKKQTWTLNKSLSKAGREVHNWLPIHDWTEDQVFGEIESVGQEPFWAYAAGNKRLSCVFCILGCSGDLKNGKKHRPELFKKYLELEQETGWTMFHKKSLKEVAV